VHRYSTVYLNGYFFFLGSNLNYNNKYFKKKKKKVIRVAEQFFGPTRWFSHLFMASSRLMAGSRQAEPHCLAHEVVRPRHHNSKSSHHFILFYFLLNVGEEKRKITRK
jgi:hypothetical protein